MNKFTSNLSKIRSLASTSEKKQAKKNDPSPPEKKNLAEVISPRTFVTAKPRVVLNRESTASDSDQARSSSSEDEFNEDVGGSTTTSSGSFEPLVPRDKPLVRRDDIEQHPSEKPLALVISPRKGFPLATPSVPRPERARFELTRNPTAIERARTRKTERLHKKRGAYTSTKTAAFTKPEITSVRKNLPTGMNVDINGNVFGQYTFTHHPMDGFQYSGKPIEEAIMSKQTHELAKTTSIAGVKVAEYITRDFFRLNYEIPTNDGQANPFTWASDEQTYQHAVLSLKPDQIPSKSQLISARNELRTEQVARALRDFVHNNDATPKDNENAAFVLSSMLIQHVPTEVQTPVYLPNSPFRALSTGTATDNDGKARPLTIKDSSGQEQGVIAKGLAAAKFALSRDGDNFKLTLDFPTYAEAKFKHEHLFPLHKDGVIGIHFRAEIIVDGKKAREGELAVTIPNGVQAEYSGRLKLD